MGIRVELRNEQTARPTRLPDPAGGSFDAAGDFDDVILRLDETFPVLRRVDPDGDTLMRSSAMPALLEELDRLATLDLNSSQRRGLDRLRVLATACGSNRSATLWFVGD